MLPASVGVSGGAGLGCSPLQAGGGWLGAGAGSTQSKYLDDKYYFRQTRSRPNIYTALVGLRRCDGWDTGHYHGSEF